MKKRKIINYAIGPIGSAAVGFITLPIITWFYSIEDIGRISMLQVVTQFIVLIFSLGLDQNYVRNYYENKDKPQLFKACFIPGFIILSIFSILIILINPYILSELLYDTKSVLLSLISILCFFFLFSTRFLSLILRMQEQSLAYSMSQLIPKLLFLALILGIVFFNLEKNTYTLIIAHMLSIFTVSIVFGWNTRKEWYISLAKKIDFSLLKQYLKFGLPLVVAGFSLWGLNVTGRLFLRSFSTFSELGLYSVAMNIASAVTILTGVFNVIWSPMVFKWINEEKKVNLDKIDNISHNLLAAIFFTIAISGCFSWILPFLLPVEYASIQFLITACLMGPLFYTLSETTAIGITIARKTSFSMYASAGAMLVNIIGNFILTPKFGAGGAAISTAIAYLFFYILRTELSCLVWRKIPRLKIYLLLLPVFLVTIISLILKNTYLTISLYTIMLLIGSFIFKSSIILALNFLLKNKKLKTI